MKNIDTLVEKVVNGQVSVAELEQISRIVAHGELGASNHAVEVLLNRLNALSEENRIVREQYRQCNSSMASTGAVPFQDIAPLEKHEQMLCPFKICVDQAPDAILWLKQSAQIVYANDQACHLLGYCRDELLNLNLNQIVVGFDQDFWDKRWEVGPDWKKCRRRRRSALESPQRRASHPGECFNHNLLPGGWGTQDCIGQGFNRA